MCSQNCLRRGYFKITSDAKHDLYRLQRHLGYGLENKASSPPFKHFVFHLCNELNNSRLFNDYNLNLKPFYRFQHFESSGFQPGAKAFQVMAYRRSK